MAKTIKNVIITFLMICLLAPFTIAQNEDNMKTEKIPAIDLYNAFKEKKEEPYKKHMQISGVATYIGPDVYALPSVELSEAPNVSGRVLCVLPFSDYLKLRKVSKGDTVIMEGNVLGFSEQYDIVVVKQCKIIEINGKEVN